MNVEHWRDCTLGDLLEVKHGYAFLGEYFGDTGTHIVLTPGNFFDDGGFKGKGDKEKWYSGPIPSDYVLNKGDLLIAMTEQAEGLLGSSAIIPRSGLYLHNQRLGLVQIRDPRATDKHFLYYLFNHKPVRQQIRASASGAKIRHTAPSRMHQVKVRIPRPAVQRRIACILSAYDELMENCQRRIRILEEMARALYREWFVHFRFPGYEEVPRIASTLCDIPEGWEVGKLADFVTTKYGYTESTNAEPVGPKYLRGMDINKTSYIDWSEVPYCPITPDDHDVYRLKVGDVVVIRMADPGKVGIVEQDVDAVFASYLIRVAPKDNRLSPYFLFHLMESAQYYAYISGASTGTTRKSASAGVIADYQFALPPQQLVELFERRVSEIRSLLTTLLKQTVSLRRTRDLLLPRLLSGQVALDVSAAEDEAETTASAALGSQTDPASAEPALRAAEEAAPYRTWRASNGSHPPAKPADEAPVPIDQTDRTEVLQVIRQVFSVGPPRERDTAIRDVARALGYRRIGPRIHKILHTDLMTAVRRCILENQHGVLHLCARSIADYDRDFLKQQFLAAIGRAWIDRDTATRDFCRWLGFARTGPIIEGAARSIINGLLREGRLATDGSRLIRKV